MQARVIGEWFSQEGDFNPLEGLMNEPKVSLEEAIAASGVDGLDDDVYEAHRFALITPDDTLDAEEVASAHFYSRQTPFYSSMNKALHSRTRSEAKKFFPYLRLMLGGLFKCPLEYSTLKRGIRDPTDQLHRQVRGQAPFYWWGFTSTSEQLGETDQFLGQNESMLFVIAGAGVNIQRFSAFPDEKEILLLPGSLLNVESSLTRSGLTIVQLTQQVPPPIFDAVHPMSEILDHSKRHTKTWQRAWGTPKGLGLGAAALLPAICHTTRTGYSGSCFGICNGFCSSYSCCSSYSRSWACWRSSCSRCDDGWSYGCRFPGVGCHCVHQLCSLINSRVLVYCE
jgi:hypothetical protein